MSTSERDIHFAGWAKRLVDDIQVKGFTSRAEFETYLAQRAYDLLDYASQYVMTRPEDVPDLTAWPEQEEKQA